MKTGEPQQVAKPLRIKEVAGEWHGPFKTCEEAYECAKRCNRAKTDFCAFCASNT